jgi:hypothetical protein
LHLGSRSTRLLVGLTPQNLTVCGDFLLFSKDQDDRLNYSGACLQFIQEKI